MKKKKIKTHKKKQKNFSLNKYIKNKKK
jgi:hypothetical protein